MADDEWSALDEELEKALSGKKGRGKGGRGGDRGGSDHGSGRAGHPPVRRDAPAPPPAPLDEWSALDEELEKLERRGKGSDKNRGNDGAGSRRPDQPRSNTTIVNNNNNVNINTNHTVSFRTKPLGSSLLLRPPAAERDAKLAARAARFAAPPAAPSTSSSSVPAGGSEGAAAASVAATSSAAATSTTFTTPSTRPRHIVGTCRLMCPPRSAARASRRARLTFWNASIPPTRASPLNPSR